MKSKELNRLVAMILVILTLFCNCISTNAETLKTAAAGDTVSVSSTGIVVKNKYYSQQQFMSLLEKAYENAEKSNYSDIKVQSVSLKRVAGKWWIAGIGLVVITKAGAVTIGGVTVKAGTWVYKKVKAWFANKEKLSKIKAKIPSRLKKKNGDVDLGKFNQNVKGKTAYKEKGGWTIEKDDTKHGGSAWKLKDKGGDRVASLDKNGKVLRK